jgi:hypothetical protein
MRPSSLKLGFEGITDLGRLLASTWPTLKSLHELSHLRIIRWM